MHIIEVDHVTKEFRLGQLRSLRQGVFDLVARVRGRGTGAQAPFKALDDVSFTVKPGEVVGLIGRNGAGKSTLLKILAGISRPSHGRVAVYGKVAPLIEVSAGLVPDLTGRENIYLNGTILGMKRADIKRKFDQIVDFAEIEGFVDTPVKRYSSGMLVRLGFSIATSVQADILIIDEVLAVGDIAFQRKCYDRLEEAIRHEGRTVLFVSHNLRQVERLCSRAILLDHGRVVESGQPKQVCDRYFDETNIHMARVGSAVSRKVEQTDQFEFISVNVLDSNGLAVDSVNFEEQITIVARFKAVCQLDRPVFTFGIHTTDLFYLSMTGSEGQIHLDTLAAGEYVVRCKVDRLPFTPGVYALLFLVETGRSSGRVFYGENLLVFHVKSPIGERLLTTDRHGFFALNAAWHQPTPNTEAPANELVDLPRWRARGGASPG